MEDQDFAVIEFATGLSSPLFLTGAPGRDDLFVAEQGGAIQILDPETGLARKTPLITIDDLSTGGERGLLGLAFDPAFETNGHFYVNITDSAGDTVIRRYTVDPADPNRADPATAFDILSIDQPRSNHNGGWIDFGPDGFLYIATGDGGGSGDPDNNAQTFTDNLLGKILRIDPSQDAFPDDDARNYAIPADNPNADGPGDPEIWSYGLRNPFRAGFDAETGDLYIADVGQDEREEINFLPAGDPGDDLRGAGANFGWRLREGDLPFSDDVTTQDFIVTDPVHVYAHGTGPDGGFSVTGGTVYRGGAESLQGQYLFADFITDNIWSLTVTDGVASEAVNRNDAFAAAGADDIASIVAFGEDNNNKLFLVSIGGSIYAVETAEDGALGVSRSGTGAAETITGGEGPDFLRGGAGDDFLDGLGGNDRFDGGDGFDTVTLPCISTNSTILYDAEGALTVRSRCTGDDYVLINVEQVEFFDATVSLSHEDFGDVGQLYFTAFGRAPDAGGLQFWLDRLEAGVSLETIALRFTESDEFQDTYGELSNRAFIEQLYLNSLDREGDAGGIDFWTGGLDSGNRTRNELLVSFSRADETEARADAALEAGEWLV